MPDLPSDNALPRWLAEIAGVPVHERPAWRLRVDVDDPLDLVLLRRARPSMAIRIPAGVDTSRVAAALDRVAEVARDRSAELLVAGRTSSTSARLARATHGGSGAGPDRGARPAASDPSAASPRRSRARPPASVLGELLDRDGPEALGASVARLGDAALDRHARAARAPPRRDERRWPAAEDRFASDLLLHERIADPWLPALTRSAPRAPSRSSSAATRSSGPGIRLALR